MYKKIILILAMMISSFALFATEPYLDYQVQRGDTLGKILFEMNYSPLWGAHGFVKKTIDLNEGKLLDGGDFIIVGAFIKLPLKEENFVIKKTIASVEEAPVISEIDVKSFLFLSLSGLMIEIESRDISTNALARIESKINHSYGISLNTQWDERVWSHIGFGQSSLDFKQPEQRSINNSKKTFSSMYIGGTYQAGTHSSVGLYYEAAERPYLMASASGDLKIESPWLHRFILSLDQKIISRKNGSLSLGIKPYLVMKKSLDDIEIKNGKGAIFEIKSMQKIMGFNFEALMFYELLKQDSNVVRQTTKSNGIKLSLIIPLGE
jgi:hypothetical protein